MIAHDIIITALTISTFIYGVFIFLIWLKTRFLGFVIGLIALYYWTLLGAWILVYEEVYGRLQLTRYHHLFQRLFPVRLDEDYLSALLLYSLFLLIVSGWILMFARRHSRMIIGPNPLQLSHAVFIACSAAALVPTYMLSGSVIEYAVQRGVSAYGAIHGGGGKGMSLFAVHQVFLNTGTMSLGIGMGIWFSGKKGLYLRARSQGKASAIGYCLLLAIWFTYCAILGDKSTLVFAIAVTVLIYFANCPRTRPLAGITFGIAAMAVVLMVDTIRSMNPTEISLEFLLTKYEEMILKGLFSNEAFGAHFSMYGVLRYDCPFTYGSDVLTFLVAWIPRFIWADRPQYNYWHYAEHVGAATDQGFTIHHATAWYLDFHIAGLALAGVLMAYIWTSLYNKWGQLAWYKQSWKRALIFIAPISFSAFTPIFIRGGIGSYKGYIISGLIVPWVIITASSFFASHAIKRP